MTIAIGDRVQHRRKGQDGTVQAIRPEVKIVQSKRTCGCLDCRTSAIKFIRTGKQVVVVRWDKFGAKYDGNCNANPDRDWVSPADLRTGSIDSTTERNHDGTQTFSGRHQAEAPGL